MSIRIACAAAVLACAGVAQAAPPPVSETMTKEAVKANLVRSEEQYDHAQARCKRVQGHARELCREQARAERDIQVAELEFQVHPTPENDQKLRLTKAQAAYSLALVKCKDFEGQARSVCRKDAKTMFEGAQAEAKLQQEVAAQSLRAENTVRERTQQAERLAEAQFTAARQRCNLLPLEGRENCLADAKKRFGRL